MHYNTVYEWILPTTFTVAERAKSLQIIKPYLSALVRTGDQVLDLCCGSGPASFWFEESGAKVTGIDFALYMMALAREEASRRNSTVEFVEADIFRHELEQERYDMIACHARLQRVWSGQPPLLLDGQIDHTVGSSGDYISTARVQSFA